MQFTYHAYFKYIIINPIASYNIFLAKQTTFLIWVEMTIGLKFFKILNIYLIKFILTFYIPKNIQYFHSLVADSISVRIPMVFMQLFSINLANCDLCSGSTGSTFY